MLAVRAKCKPTREVPDTAQRIGAASVPRGTRDKILPEKIFLEYARESVFLEIIFVLIVLRSNYTQVTSSRWVAR